MVRQLSGVDNLLQPRIGGLYHGVSRQAPLQRSANQMQELDNFLPSVDVGGIVDRTGTSAQFALSRALYASTAHHFFRTTDGQRWVLLRRAEYGTMEVRNLDTGLVAPITMGAFAQNYIGSSTNLKFLSLADTTLILNTDVVVSQDVSAKPALGECYVVVRRVSTAKQTYTVGGAGTASVALTVGNSESRESVAQALLTSITANLSGLSWASRLGTAPHIIKIVAPPETIAIIHARNDWDEAAMLLIKGRVSSSSDLPSSFDPGVPIAVDTGSGDFKSLYYVRYDPTVNAWVECSYLANGATTARLSQGTMPMRLRQVTSNSFEITPCPWGDRVKGDDASNPQPFFVGRRISALAHWKGRLWMACEDTITSSQPDDLFNFWRESAREVRPADPIELPADAPDLSVIQHVIPFRNKLMVTADNAQLEIPGDKPLTPEDATMGVATRYQLDKDCTPQVIGDALYYTGQAEGRSALWEYSYDDGAASNTAFDLSKHIPGYVPGRVQRIRGASQAGRIYLWTPADPARLYVHTGYWKDGQRAQSAWSRLTFPGLTGILDHWVDQTDLYILAQSAAYLWVVKMPVDVSLGQAKDTDLRLDFHAAVNLYWNPTLSRTEAPLPPGFTDHSGSLLLLVDMGDSWYRELAGSVVTINGTPTFVTPVNTGKPSGILGRRFERTATFSPFYPSLGESVTPMGRLQVRNVIVDALVNTDFSARVKRADRPDAVVRKTARIVGEALLPVQAYNSQHTIPFNAQGHKAELSLTSESTGPLAVTGISLVARYTNVTAQ